MRATGKLHWSEATPLIREVGFAKIRENTFVPKEWFARRIIDFDLWLVCSGRMHLKDQKGNENVLTRGSIVLLKPGDQFEMRVDAAGPYSNFFVHFDLLDADSQVIPHYRIKIPSAFGSV